VSDPIDLSGHRRPRRRIWLALAGWTGVALTFGLILRVQVGLALPDAFVSSFAWYYPLGVLVWIACGLDRRLELWRRMLARALLTRAAIGLTAVVLWAVTIVTWSRWSVGPDYWRLVFADAWPFQLATTACIYAAGVGIGLTLQNSDRERERQQRELQLQVLARESELTAIRAQLQPHFLFNALNSILALMEHDPAGARRMLTLLASLLHSVFDRLDEPLVSLDRELETIRDYLDIERIRFGDRMTFTVDADGAAKHVPVPPFLLQPIVENAVKHGIEPCAHPGSVCVAGSLDGGRLRLSVTDSGPGIDGATLFGGGRGLALTRRRLETVYGTEVATISTNRGPDGFTVTLEIPVALDVR